MKVLYIKASPKPKDKSVSHRIAEAFIEEYKKNNPKDEITELNLHDEGCPYVDYKILCDSFEGKGLMVETANKFVEYDKFIISSPMWNLSIPAILKSYIDLITVKGITFEYSRLGIPRGLAKGKKAFYLGSRGGGYPFPLSLIAFDMRYIKYIFRFIGIKNFKSFILENVDKSPEKTKQNFEKSLEKVRKLARRF
ncbi:FMN-dependent NADH-azoreductase [Psychrilyobacter atlanticus]|uniref:FMN-dependent NADH-azoreductase n=1 Tax=Psychrilyobacter atlanticus TaxID=271091 RepID=UPI0004197DF2|nr:NAD(P)H-dependent oxidoreductase [Psychrilyobacter atlanticus]